MYNPASSYRPVPEEPYDEVGRGYRQKQRKRNAARRVARQSSGQARHARLRATVAAPGRERGDPRR
jgi:hypothetical protein